jgi:hypothetical protein
MANSTILTYAARRRAVSAHDLRQNTVGVSDLGDVRTATPQELERDLRAALRGARLVFELGIDQARYDAVRAAITRLAVSGHRPAELRRSYPALYVSYLVFTGAFRYESGTFWADVHPKLTAQGLDAGCEFWSPGSSRMAASPSRAWIRSWSCSRRR